MKDIEAIKALRSLSQEALSVMDGHARDWKAIKTLRLVESDFDDWGRAHKKGDYDLTWTPDWEVQDVYPRWTCWAREIPALNVDSSWSVHMRAHTPGSLVRFRVYERESYLWEVLVYSNEMHAFYPSREGEKYLEGSKWISEETGTLNAKKITESERGFGYTLNYQIDDFNEILRIQKFLPAFKFYDSWDVKMTAAGLWDSFQLIVSNDRKKCYVNLGFSTHLRSENSAFWEVFLLRDAIKSMLDGDDES